MDYLKKMKRFLENKAEYWYIVIAIFVVMEIANDKFFKWVIPVWGCAIVSICLIILLTIYVGIIYKYFREKYKRFLMNNYCNTIDRIICLESIIQELDEKHVELQHNLEKDVIEKIQSETGEAVKTIKDSMMSSKQEMIGVVKETSTNSIDNLNNALTVIMGRFDKQQTEYSSWREEHKRQTEQNVETIAKLIEKSDTKLKNLTSQVENKIDAVYAQLNMNSDNIVGSVHSSEEKIVHMLKIQMQREEDVNSQTIAFMSDANKSIENSILELKKKVEADISDLSVFANENYIKYDRLMTDLEGTIKTGNESILVSVQESLDEELEKCDGISNELVLLSQGIAEQFKGVGEAADSRSNVLLEKITELDNIMSMKLGDVLTVENTNHNIVDEKIQSLTEVFMSQAEKSSKNDDDIKQRLDELRISVDDNNNEIKVHISDLSVLANENYIKCDKLMMNLEGAIKTGNESILARVQESLDEELEKCDGISNELVLLSQGIAEQFRDVGESANSRSNALLEKMTESDNIISMKLDDVLTIENANHTIIDEKIQSFSEVFMSQVEKSSKNDDDIKQRLDELRTSVDDNNNEIKVQLNDKTETILSSLNLGNDDIKYDNEQRSANLEHVIMKKISETRDIETNIFESILEQKKNIEDLYSNDCENYKKLLDGNEKIQKELKQRDINILEKLTESNTKLDSIDNGNKENFVELKEKILCNEQTSISIAEKFSEKTLEMQTILTNLLTQVLDDIEEYDEIARASYDRIFNQVSGFSNSTRTTMDIILQELDVNKQTVDKEMEMYVSVANNQIEQVNDLKLDILENAKRNQSYQVELSSRIDNLQSQIISLSALAQVLKTLPVNTEINNDSKKPNRVEEITDKDTGITVHNHYNNNKLVLSEMFRNKKKMYEAEYNTTGQISKTQNFAQDGSVVTELQFYSNGQVKTRIEKLIVNGKKKLVITNFDENGNKK